MSMTVSAASYLNSARFDTVEISPEGRLANAKAQEQPDSSAWILSMRWRISLSIRTES